MADPDPKDGHIDIANTIADKFCSFRLNGREWQIIWVILRKTWGWLENPTDKSCRKKKMDRISLSQFEKFTGIHRSKCHLILKKLVENQILKRKVAKQGNKTIMSYGLQTNFEKWVGVPTEGITQNGTVPKNGSSQKRTKGVPVDGNTLFPPMGTKVFPKMGTTKDTNTKDTYTKETITKDTLHDKPKTDHQSVIEFWDNLFLQSVKSKYDWKKPKDFANLKNLLKTYGLERLKELMIQLFVSNDPFYVDKWSIGMLTGCSNKLAQELQSKKQGLDRFTPTERKSILSLKKAAENYGRSRKSD